MKLSRRAWRTGMASVLLGTAASAFALNTATITGSVLSPDCLSYRVQGICYGCTARSPAVRCAPRSGTALRSRCRRVELLEHRENPWLEVRAMSMPNPTAQGGGDGTTNEEHENNLAKFKNADVIGHPGATIFSEFVSQLGYSCAGAGTAFMPYLLSTLDTVAWRYNIPEAFYPEALIPGMREIGTRTGLNLWGNVYPRGGFLHHVDDYKAAAVVAACRRHRDPAWAGPCLSAAACQCEQRGLLARRCLGGKRCLHGKVAGIDASAVILLRGLPTQQRPHPGPARRLRLGAVAPVLLLPAARTGVLGQHGFQLRCGP